MAQTEQNPRVSAPNLEVAAHDLETGQPGRVNAAYQAIKAAIRNNTFPPGFQAAEVEIARQLGMSRTPVHEAMARLQEDGLVRILSRKGILICPLSPEDIEEIYEITIALEGAAAAKIAGFMETERDAGLTALREATNAMRTAIEAGDMQAWAAADENFHELLLSGSGNKRLMRMAGTVADQLHRTRMLTLNLRPPPLNSAEEHDAIIAAIQRGDSEGASQAARYHRQRAKDQLIPLIRKLNLRNL
ncbi:GntR family transcriptional regulator [Rhizobium sp. FKY42]|uniref:GntR family transcriptional regulator n=1 Tax=Rhizobium sp. FKY42 TaxID=2562310 RepID=UPI0010BF73AF|nr:GntR family transcriptional regulator [Rhizobium sp. FKY42]